MVHNLKIAKKKINKKSEELTISLGTGNKIKQGG